MLKQILPSFETFGGFSIFYSCTKTIDVNKIDIQVQHHRDFIKDRMF